MKRLSVLVIAIFILCSCSLEKPEIVDLVDPDMSTDKMYGFEITVENVVKNSTHVVIAELEEVEPYGEDDYRCIFTFTVKSVLAGDLPSDTIKIIRLSSFYQYNETYLLFLYCMSSSIWPFDVYVPFDIFTFRINEDDSIEALQTIEDLQTQSVRTFTKPFKNDDHNKLGFLKNYIKSLAKSVKKVRYASTDRNLEYLDKQSDIVLVITPIKMEPVEQNPYVVDVWYEVTETYKRTSSTSTWMMLPSTVGLHQKYLVFLTEVEQGFFALTSRGSFFPEGSPEYEEYLPGR